MATSTRASSTSTSAMAKRQLRVQVQVQYSYLTYKYTYKHFKFVHEKKISSTTTSIKYYKFGRQHPLQTATINVRGCPERCQPRHWCKTFKQIKFASFFYTNSHAFSALAPLILDWWYLSQVEVGIVSLQSSQNNSLRTCFTCKSTYRHMFLQTWCHALAVGWMERLLKPALRRDLWILPIFHLVFFRTVQRNESREPQCKEIQWFNSRPILLKSSS